MTDVTKDQAEALYDDGLLNVSTFLYVLRNEAGEAAEKLAAEISRMTIALEEAKNALRKLEGIARRAEMAAEREAENDD